MTNKDLIKQYVNTGREIKPKQFDLLSNSDKKTYLRARYINFESKARENEYFEFEDFEFIHLPDDKKNKYIKYVLDNPEHCFLNSRLQFESCSKEEQIEYVTYKISYFHKPRNYEMAVLPDEIKRDYFNNQMKNWNFSFFEDDLFVLMPEDIMEKYIHLQISEGNLLSNLQFKCLNEELQNKYLENVKGPISKYQMDLMSEKEFDDYIKRNYRNAFTFGEIEIDYWNKCNEEQKKFLVQKLALVIGKNRLKSKELNIFNKYQMNDE